MVSRSLLGDEGALGKEPHIKRIVGIVTICYRNDPQGGMKVTTMKTNRNSSQAFKRTSW